MGINVSQSLSDFFGDHPSARMKGAVPAAVGNGAANDTAGLTAAIRACSAIGSDLFIPAGEYLISHSTWYSGLSVLVNDHILDASNHIQLCTTSGISGSTLPTFNHSGGTTSDGTVVWTDQGIGAAVPYLVGIGSDLYLRGAGIGVSIIKVADGTGSYETIFGPKFNPINNLTISDLTVDQNSTGNPLVSSADLTNYPRFVLSVTNGVSNLTVRDCEFSNLQCVNAIQSGATNVVIADNRFLGIGLTAGSFDFDHSTLYIASNFAVIHNNLFEGVINGLGSGTAIETHGGKQTVTGNVIDSMESGMNITGIDPSGDDEGVTVTGNTIQNGYNGITLWSGQELSHTTGYGLAGCTVSGNTIRLKQTLWTLSGFGGTALGIQLNLTANLPFKSIIISGNVVEFDLSVSSSEPQDQSGFGIGYWDATTLNIVENLIISGNSIVNSPGAAIRVSARCPNVNISDNKIINPGSTLNTGFAGSFRCGVFFSGWVYNSNWTASTAIVAGQVTILDAANHIQLCTTSGTTGSTLPTFNDTGGTTSDGTAVWTDQGELVNIGVRVMRNQITDNLTTTRMHYGILFASLSTNDIVSEGNIISILGSTVSALVSPVDSNTNTQMPVINDSVYSPALASIVPIFEVAQSSTIRDLTNGVIYVYAPGVGWSSVRYGTAPPASGAFRDIVYNSSPGTYAPIVAWICTVGGSSATWYPIQALDLTQTLFMTAPVSITSSAGNLLSLKGSTTSYIEIFTGGVSKGLVGIPNVGVDDVIIESTGNGNINLGPAAGKQVFVAGPLQTSGPFGANNLPPQAAYPSGGLVPTTTPTLAAYGYTLAQAAAIITALNNIITALGANGIMS